MSFSFIGGDDEDGPFSIAQRREIERQIEGRPRRVKKTAAVHASVLDMMSRELDVVSRTTPGRRAFDAFAWEFVEGFSGHSLSELAQFLRCGPEGEFYSMGFPWVLGHAHDRPEFALVALVAMRRANERTLSLIDPHGRDEDAATDLLREFYASLPSETLVPQEFVSELHRRTRRGVRARAQERSDDREFVTNDHLDLELSAGDPAEVTGDLVAQLVREGVMSHDDAALLVRTHVLGEDMAELARERDTPYRTLQSQRLRAENAVRGYLRRSELD